MPDQVKLSDGTILSTPQPRPRQLVHHLVEVGYYHPNHGYDSRMTYQVADPEESRRCGREIAFWLARGVGYEVRSVTKELKRNNL